MLSTHPFYALRTQSVITRNNNVKGHFFHNANESSFCWHTRIYLDVTVFVCVNFEFVTFLVEPIFCLRIGICRHFPLQILNISSIHALTTKTIDRNEKFHEKNEPQMPIVVRVQKGESIFCCCASLLRSKNALFLGAFHYNDDGLPLHTIQVVQAILVSIVIRLRSNFKCFKYTLSYVLLRYFIVFPTQTTSGW